MLALAWTDWEKTLRTSAAILDEVRTYHLPNTNLQRYRLANLPL
jgi:hypothetical protein